MKKLLLNHVTLNLYLAECERVLYKKVNLVQGFCLLYRLIGQCVEFLEDSIGFRGRIPLNASLGELWPTGSLL